MNDKIFLFKTKNYEYFVAKNNLWKLFTFLIVCIISLSLYILKNNLIFLIILIVFLGGILFIQRVPKFAFGFIQIPCKNNKFQTKTLK